MNEKDSRKAVYGKIVTIISNDDNFPAIQAEQLQDLAKDDGRLFLVFYLLLVALRVFYWRRAGSILRRDADNYDQNAGMLEALNIDI